MSNGSIEDIEQYLYEQKKYSFGNIEISIVEYAITFNGIVWQAVSERHYSITNVISVRNYVITLCR